MGLISATLGSVSKVVGDQFKEFITCPTQDTNVLVVRGRVEHGSGNKNYTEGIITNGSKIVVPSGYAMMLVDNGAIKEFSAEPGEYIWDSSTEPSVFEGGFFKGLKDSIKTIGSRITYGGHEAHDQRVYYVNLLTITGNKFGSKNPETIYDPLYGSVEITYFGEYSFKVVDPVVLVTNLIGANPKDTITVSDVIDGQLKLQFASNVSTCISDLMVKNNVSFNTVQSYKNDVVKVMNSLLDESWKQQYGLEVLDVALNINASEESKKIIREVDAELSREKRRGELYASNTSGLMAAATADAMVSAAGNENGALMGFMGMNMASSTAGNVMSAAQNMQQTSSTNPLENPINNQSAPGNTTLNTDIPVKETTTTAPKFCSNCGTPVTGKFCSNCGAKIGE